jgi:rod shape-determining protein MreC
MRNIFLLITRFKVLLLFLLLQVLAITLLVRYSHSHQAAYMQIAYEVTGRINRSYASLIGFFALADNNRRLAERVTELSNELKQNFTFIDTSVVAREFVVRQDSTTIIRKYFWRPARVINNSVSSQNNYITLERGQLQGIQKGMAVVSASGIVGIVTDVSDNMSIVMSLLHRKSSTSVALAKSGINGILEWDGQRPDRLQLRNIPKSAKIAVGDTVITSAISFNYPQGLMAGTIASFKLDDAGNNYIVQVKPGTNFYTLDFVSVIENRFLNEQKELEARIKR